MRAFVGIFSILGVISMFALAQDRQEEQMDNVVVMESEQYGPYLTDGQGITLYLFLSDPSALEGASLEPMTEGVREQAGSCTEACLENWPPLLADVGQEGVFAGEGVEHELLYAAEVDGRNQVVYNGWPLYYYVEDQFEGDILGQGRGDRWFIVSPDGMPIQDADAGAEGAG